MSCPSQIPKSKTSIADGDRIGERTFADRMLSVVEAAAYLGVSKSWLDKSRLLGDGPTYVKVSRRVVYSVADLEAFVSKKRHHASEAG